MCRVTMATNGDSKRPGDASSSSQSDDTATKKNDISSSPSSPWQWLCVHPLIVAAAIPLCPVYFFMNRGFTQWFHWGFIFYLLTGRGDFLRRFLVICGGGVCVGWYAAVAHDSLVHGRTCHLLYNNMPGSVKALMLENGYLASGGIIANTASGVAAMVGSHVVDLIAHPYLTYVAWKNFRTRGGSFRNLVTWDVLVCAYAIRIFYSVSHQYYNWGYVNSAFYYGYEVYHIDNLDAYTAAYIGETIWFCCLALYKIYLLSIEHDTLGLNVRVGKEISQTPPTQAKQPASRMSSSCFSDESTNTDGLSS